MRNADPSEGRSRAETVGLITRRSRVQISPPLHRDRQVKNQDSAATLRRRVATAILGGQMSLARGRRIVRAAALGGAA